MKRMIIDNYQNIQYIVPINHFVTICSVFNKKQFQIY